MDDDAVAFTVWAFRDMGLAEADQGRVAEVVTTRSGGDLYARVLALAKKMPGESWVGLPLVRRRDCITMAAKREVRATERAQLVVRTGACLALDGDVGEGGRLIRLAGTIDMDPRIPVSGKVDVVNYPRGVSAALLGLWALILIAGIGAAQLEPAATGAVMVAVSAIMLWVFQGRAFARTKVHANILGYAAAIERVERGADPRSVFSRNGDLLATS